jgi:hypothetical protein
VNRADGIVYAIHHTIGIDCQHVLRTLIVEEAIERREPEGQSPSVLRVAEDAENLRHLLARAVVIRIQRVQREVVVSPMLDRKDVPIALPLVRLHTRVGSPPRPAHCPLVRNVGSNLVAKGAENTGFSRSIPVITLLESMPGSPSATLAQ